jgi:hypothetical protein
VTLDDLQTHRRVQRAMDSMDASDGRLRDPPRKTDGVHPAVGLVFIALAAFAARHVRCTVGTDYRSTIGQQEHGLRLPNASVQCAPQFVAIVGAGPAGLAMGARLLHAGVPFAIFEQAATAGSAWRDRYERLHLHSHKDISALPYWGFPHHYPTFVSTHDLADYYEAYAATMHEHVHYLHAWHGMAWHGITRASSEVRTRNLLAPHAPCSPGD